LIYVEDETGCSFERTVNLMPGNTIEVTTIDTITVNEGDTLTLESTVIQSGQEVYYNWSSQDPINCEDCPNANLAAFSDQSITLTVTDENGCSDESIIDIRVNELSDMWVGNIFAAGADNVINQNIALYSASFVEKINDFSIYDRWGNIIYTIKDVDPDITELTWDGTSNGRYVDSGVYILRVEYELFTGERKSYLRDISFFR